MHLYQLMDVAGGWTNHTRPADILASNWDGSASAAFGISVTSPLNSSLVVEAGMSSDVAARAAEKRKHLQNDAKCKQLGWRCIPLVVETYGAWGAEAIEVFSTVHHAWLSFHQVKSSGHPLWSSQHDSGTGQCWSYSDAIIPAIICI